MDLRTVKSHVDDALKARYALPTGSPLFPLDYYLTERGRRSIWRLVGYLRTHERDTYNLFAYDEVLFDEIVGSLAGYKSAPKPKTLVYALRRKARQSGEWLIRTPIANLIPPEPYIRLDASRTALVETLRQRDWTRWHYKDRVPPFAMKDHLGVWPPMDAGQRWDHTGPRGGRMDTHNAAVIFSKEKGTLEIAQHRAHARTNYIIAIWCLLDPPEQRRAWPSLGLWLPQPYASVGHQAKLIAGKGRSQRATYVSHRSLHPLANDPTIIAAPMSALEMVETRRSARAVVSAAWQLYQAAQVPRNLELTDSLMHIYAALDALESETLGVWPDAARKLGVWKHLHWYTEQERSQAERLARDVRNITEHGNDDVLINLGYPPHLQRSMRGGRQVSGRDLSIALVTASFPIMLNAAQELTRRLFRGAMQHGWDDSWYDDQFRP